MSGSWEGDWRWTSLLRTTCIPLASNLPCAPGSLTVCYFHDNYVLQIYRRPMFDVAIYETMTPFHTFHVKVLKRMTHFLL